MSARAALAAALLAAALAVPAAAQEDLRLVRCGPGGRAACLSAAAVLRPEDARALARAGDAGGTWAVRLGAREVEGARGTVRPEARPPLRLLVLVDVSGSMKGEGIEIARPALRSFLRDLPAGSVRAAVVPFASARVAERIGAARFVPGPEAEAQVDSLPAPEGNTGLFSAVAAGVERLAAERAAAGGAGWDALLVLTDGDNDVGKPGDDPGLLGDTEGPRVVEAIRAGGAYVFAVGLGAGVDAGELRALGGVRGESFRVAGDAVALRRAFAAVGEWLRTSRGLLVPAGGAGEARLTARPLSLEATAAAGEGRAGAGPWTPPLVALPAFQGAAPADDRVVVRADPWWLRRFAVLAFLAGVLLILWTAVPPLLVAPEPARARPLPAPGEDAAPAPVRVRLRRGGGEAVTLPLAGAAVAAAATDASGLRRDLGEAPPRRPTDVTARVSRPAARAGGPAL